MAVERGFKAAKLELMMENLRWRGVAKVRMHVARMAVPKMVKNG
jgi:hypothetical protein